MMKHNCIPWLHFSEAFQCRPSHNNYLQQPNGQCEDLYTLSQPPLAEKPPVAPDNISAIPCQPVASSTKDATEPDTTRNTNWNIEIEAWLADLKAKRLPSLLNALNDVRGIYTSLNHLILTHRIKELQKQNGDSTDFLRTYLDAQSGQLLDVDAHIVDEATAVVADIWKATSFVIAGGQADVCGQVPIFVGKNTPSACCDCSRSTSVGASSSVDKAANDTSQPIPQVNPPESSPTQAESAAADPNGYRVQSGQEPNIGAVDADVSMESNVVGEFERQQSVFVDAGSPTVERRGATATHIDVDASAETAYRIHRRGAGGTRRSCRMPVTRSQTAQQAKRKRRLSDGSVGGREASPPVSRESKRVRRGSTPVQRPATAPVPEVSKCVDEEGFQKEAEVIDCEASSPSPPVEETSSPSPPVEETSRIFCTHHGDVSKTENYHRGFANRFLCSLCDEETEELRKIASQRGWPLEELTYESSSHKWVARFICKDGHKFRLDHTLVRKQPWCPLCYDTSTKRTNTNPAKSAQSAWTQAHQRILFATARENLRRTKYVDDLDSHPWMHPAHRLGTSPESLKASTKANKKSLFSKAYTDADEDASITIERLVALGSGSSPWSVLCIAPPAGGSRKRLRSKDPLYLEARSRYKQWVKRVHPDKNGHRYAKEAFHILDSAWKQIESQVLR